MQVRRACVSQQSLRVSNSDLVFHTIQRLQGRSLRFRDCCSQPICLKIPLLDYAVCCGALDCICTLFCIRAYDTSWDCCLKITFVNPEKYRAGGIKKFKQASMTFMTNDMCNCWENRGNYMQSRAAAGQWGVKDALSVLHNMLSSDGMPEPLNSTLRLRSISVKAQSSGPNLDRSASTQQKSISSMSSNCTASFRPSSDSVLRQTNSRRLSFSTPKAFAKGQQWPRLPHAALNHCKVIPSLVYFLKCMITLWHIRTSWPKFSRILTSHDKNLANILNYLPILRLKDCWSKFNHRFFIAGMFKSWQHVTIIGQSSSPQVQVLEKSVWLVLPKRIPCSWQRTNFMSKLL